ncbi:MAG: type II CAAX endopeptidase family protein [Vicinamibacteria bacterium]
MSQSRSSTPFLLGSLLSAAAAYGLSLYAMAQTQQALMTKFELRLVLIGAEMALALPPLFVAALLASRIPGLYRFHPLRRWAIPLTVALGLALWTLSLGVFEAQYVLVRPPQQYLDQFQGLHETLRPGSAMGWVFSIAAIAVAPAICEEILFRGLLVPVLRNAVGSALAIVISGVMFGLIHIDAMPGPGGGQVAVYYRVPFAFILGMLLAKIRIDTESLWPSMIAHATLNATTFVVVFLAPDQKGVMPDPQPFVALGMLALGGFGAQFLLRRIAVLDSGDRAVAAP